MKTAIVVEGSHLYHNRLKLDLLNEMWAVAIPRAVGCPPPSLTFGISKGSIVAMKLAQASFRKTTSIKEPLDYFLERIRVAHKVDCFIVIWDLVPPWDKDSKTCRWDETLAFYDGLAHSNVLEESFRTYCQERLIELKQRVSPAARKSPPKIGRSRILPICVSPLFESVFMDNRAMRACLGVSGKSIKYWPSKWEIADANAPNVIDAAIRAARKTRPRHKVFRRLHDNYSVSKTDWGLHRAIECRLCGSIVA